MTVPSYAPPTGTYPVGVCDGEFTDNVYPTRRPQERDGRRMMVRVWYPASSPDGPRRRYLSDQEMSTAGLGLTGDEPPLLPSDWIERLGMMPTHSISDSEPADGSFPTLIFSHGGLGHVSQNTPLMEELASNGYVVFSLAHPGEAAGVVYPNGDVTPFDEEFRDTVFGHGSGEVADARMSSDIGTRLDATRQMLDDKTLGPWARRWVDDIRALIDALETETLHLQRPEVLTRCDRDRLGTFGMSFGGAAAASAAHVDTRISSVVNLDGGMYLSDLLDQDIRVPLLELTCDLVGWMSRLGIAAGFLAYNEFFYEPLGTAGTRQDVVRLRIPEVIHLELTDFLLLPPAERAQRMPGGGLADAARITALVNTLVRGHFDATLQGRSGFPTEQQNAFPELDVIDLAALRAWATQGAHSVAKGH